MKKIYTIHLTQQERNRLNKIVRRGTGQARVITRSRVLLLADDGKTDPEIYEHLSLSTKTPYEIRKRYVQHGLQFALYDRPRPGQPRRFNGAQEAEIVAIACSKAPKGYAHWTLDLLTKEARSRGITIGRTAVWKVLLRSDLKPWREKMWCIPALTAEFIKRMFDVLEVYERPFDPKKPVVCIDEKSKQLLKDSRATIQAKRGKLTKKDYEYKRNGTCNIFVAVEPKGKRRKVKVTKHRSKKDYALFIRYLADKVYRRADKIILVEDNLNTHNKKSLTEAFGKPEGERIAEKIEWHFTPKHASWLNQAEIEIHALGTQCLNRRIGTLREIQSEIAECVNKRNKDRGGINWQLTRVEAGRKFRLV